MCAWWGEGVFRTHPSLKAAPPSTPIFPPVLSDESMDWTDLFTSVRTAALYHDSVMALPMRSYPVLMAYRTDLFR